jgi:hypothetical protein
MKINKKTVKKQVKNELRTIYLTYGIRITKRNEMEIKPKLKHEEQGKKRKETSYLELSPKNVHQRK